MNRIMYKAKVGNAWVKNAFTGLGSIDLYVATMEEHAGWLSEEQIRWLKETIGDVVQVMRYEVNIVNEVAE